MFGKENLFLKSLTVLLLIVLGDLIVSSGFLESPNIPEKPVCPSGEVTDEDMYMSTLEPNQYEIEKPPVKSIPAFRSETNSEGLRDQNFSIEKPEGQFRVLVVGDSQTYGLGVNESNRFTEVLERKIDNSTDTEVRVINAGLSGAGMKDYYQIVFNKAIQYNPDLVFVAFDEEDIIYRKLQDKYIQQEKERNNISEEVSIYSNNQAEEKVYQRLQNYRQNASWKESVFRTYMSKLLAMNDQYSFDLYLYRINNKQYPQLVTNPVKVMGYETVYNYWRQECGENIILSPPELKMGPNHTFHPDPHYNRGGNKVIGNWLYENLEEDILP